MIVRSRESKKHLFQGRPVGWPLRVRLTALTVALLVFLGLVVGAATEIYLSRTLNHQLDDKLSEAARRARFEFDRPIPTGGGEKSDRAPPGSEAGLVAVQLDEAGYEGGVVAYSENAGSYYESLPGAVERQLRSVVPNGQIVTVNLDTLGDYRVISSLSRNGTATVAGLSQSPTRAVLLRVAEVTAGTLVLTSVLAGWAGALIIRRTLRLLDRVALTATRVSELTLDRGDVDLSLRVSNRDTDERTEVGQVGAALNRMLEHVGKALEVRQASETRIRQFVADASHELRTPLASILGYAELGRRHSEVLPDEVAHMLFRVESEGKRMKSLVEDLLLLASLDSGRPLAHESVDLTVQIVNAVSDAHAAGPSHLWKLDLPEEPITVIGDSARLQQILANLLANARIHTPDGTAVTVGLRSDVEVAIITVTDNGPGIPVEKLPDIFGRFVRGDTSRSRKAGGAGLGLSIVNAVVTAHGGRVAAESQPGHSQFTVFLPVRPTTTIPSPRQGLRQPDIDLGAN